MLSVVYISGYIRLGCALSDLHGISYSATRVISDLESSLTSAFWLWRHEKRDLMAELRLGRLLSGILRKCFEIRLLEYRMDRYIQLYSSPLLRYIPCLLSIGT
jgi:hypothetical protein